MYAFIYLHIYLLKCLQPMLEVEKNNLTHFISFPAFHLKKPLITANLRHLGCNHQIVDRGTLHNTYGVQSLINQAEDAEPEAGTLSVQSPSCVTRSRADLGLSSQHPLGGSSYSLAS